MAHQQQLNVLAVVGSLQRNSVTRVVVHELIGLLDRSGCRTDIADLESEPLPMYNPDTSRKGEVYLRLKPRVEAADVLILGTPDYHGSVSGAIKNFLDHFWHEFAGKLFGTVVASHEKGSQPQISFGPLPANARRGPCRTGCLSQRRWM